MSCKPGLGGESAYEARVVAILGCQLHDIWNEPKTRVAGHTCEGYLVDWII